MPAGGFVILSQASSLFIFGATYATVGQFLFWLEIAMFVLYLAMLMYGAYNQGQEVLNDISLPELNFGFVDRPSLPNMPAFTREKLTKFKKSFRKQ